ncbi:50S ribosomal protein L23 [bacterium]|nr:50S ribosomal protein L23 [bacterium]
MTFREKLQQRAKKNTAPKALKTFSPYDIILSPLLTEKTHKDQEVHKYAFKVHGDANKNDIKQAVEYLYKVHPLKINIVNVPFKGRSQRKLVRTSYKKAVITLSDKENIEIGV